MDEHTHIGYADESHWNEGRYRSIALVTAAIPTAEAVGIRVARVLAESKLSGSTPEFAWKDLRTDKTLAVANQMMNITVAAAYSEPFRVDVITWDTHDSRHKLPGRDDTANLARMYYHLMIKVIEDRWPKAAWIISPDERTDMDWAELERCLSYPSRQAKESEQFVLNEQFHVTSDPPQIVPGTSHYPMIQVADLFAGLASFSWNEYSVHRAWKLRQNGQQDMFAGLYEPPSKSAEYKHRALNYLKQLHIMRLTSADRKKYEQQEKGLITRPGERINFWLYMPQRDDDKAPTRLNNRAKSVSKSHEFGDKQSGCFPQFALPNDLNTPSFARDPDHVFGVSCLCSADFRLPKFCVCRGHPRPFATVPVPQASVDKNDGFVLPKHEVGTARQQFAVETESEPGGVEGAPNIHFRLGVS